MKKCISDCNKLLITGSSLTVFTLVAYIMYIQAWCNPSHTGVCELTELWAYLACHTFCALHKAQSERGKAG